MADKPMADWDDLAREWDLWDQSARPTLWWRDDDAVDVTPALSELRQVAHVPIALAVIPLAQDRPLQKNLGNYLENWPRLSVLQHGISHFNHAANNAKKSEFPTTCQLSEIEKGLIEAAKFLREIFGSQMLPILTPPWNRISEPVLAMLPKLGFYGLSRFDEPPYRQDTSLHAGISKFREINTQIDMIDWRGNRGFVGLKPALGCLVTHLTARRLGKVNRSTPSGILTHHLVHDVATWRFLENLQDWLAKRGALDVFVDPKEMWLLS